MLNKSNKSFLIHIFSQMKLHFRVIATLIITSINKGRRTARYSFQYVYVHQYHSLLQKIPLMVTFTSTCQNCLISQKLKTLKAKKKLQLYSNGKGPHLILIKCSIFSEHHSSLINGLEENPCFHHQQRSDAATVTITSDILHHTRNKSECHLGVCRNTNSAYMKTYYRCQENNESYFPY